MLYFLVEIPIEFIVPLHEKTVEERQNVTLDVQVNKPGVQMTWKKDETEISPSERIDISIDGTVHKLNIKQAILNDEGEYMVTVGVAMSKAPLHVKGKTLLLHYKNNCLWKIRYWHQS